MFLHKNKKIYMVTSVNCQVNQNENILDIILSFH